MKYERRGIVAKQLASCRYTLKGCKRTASVVGANVDRWLNRIHAMDGKRLSDIHLKRKNNVRSIVMIICRLRVCETVVAVNSRQLFNRIIFAMKDDVPLASHMSYELAPKPPSLFDAITMRKGNKAALATVLESC